MLLTECIGQSAGFLLDISVHTSQGFATAGHKLVFLTNFSILQQFPQTDCLILPDYSPNAVRNLFSVMYGPTHRYCILYMYVCGSDQSMKL